MQGIFRKENTDKALKYGIYRHLPTYEKIIRNLVSFYYKNNHDIVYLADILGHSSVETTRIYTSISGFEHEKVLEDMELII